MPDLLQTAIDAALDAGTILMDYLGNVKNIEVKQGQQFNLVTEADKAAEACIIDRIRRDFPGHGILAEESGAADTGADVKWVIDPLDGTTSFTHGLPIFSVSIGVERKGEVVAGVVYNPAADELFHAEKNGGAYWNGKRIHASATGNLDRSLLVTGFPCNVRENPDYCLERFNAFVYAAHGYAAPAFISSVVRRAQYVLSIHQGGAP